MANAWTELVGLALVSLAARAWAASETDLRAMKAKLRDDHNWMMWATACALPASDRAYLEPELELLIRHYTHFPDMNWSNQGEWGGWSGFPHAGWSPNQRRQWGISHACGWSPVSGEGTPLSLHAPPGAYAAAKVLFARAVELFRAGRHGDAVRVIGAASHAIQDCSTFPHMQAIHRAAGFDVRRIAIPDYTPRLLGKTVDQAADALASETEAMVHRTEEMATPIRRAMAEGNDERYSQLRAACCNEAAKVVADFIHTAIALAGPVPQRKPYPVGKNLIVNPSVEEADFGEPAPRGWVAWHNDPQDRIGRTDWEGRVQRNQNLWYSGRRSLKLMWAPEKGIEWRQTWPAAVFVNAGERYRASAWLKTVDATGQSAVALQFARRNAEALATFESESLDGTQDWTRVAVEATAPPEAKRLRVLCLSKVNEGAAWFDDIELVRVDPDAAPKAKREPAAPRLHDLVLHLTFDDGRTHQVTDRSPYRGVNGPNVCISDGVPADLHTPDGRLGQAVALDGRDQFVECPSSGVQDVQCPTGPMTVLLWVFAAGRRDAVLVSKEQVARGRPVAGYRLALRKDGRASFLVHTTKGGAVALSARPVPLRRWVHVAAVRTKKGDLVVYLDGAPGKRVLCPGPPAATDAPAGRSALYLGSRSGVDNFFAGKLDDLRLLRRALSPDEIAAAAKAK